MRVAFPNLGAEEGAMPPRALAAGTALGNIAAAFVSLVEDPPWPWLRRAQGLVPWLATPEAATHAWGRGLSLWGPGPDVVRRVHDKAFAAAVARTTDPLGALAVILDADEVTPRRIEAAVAPWPSWARARFTAKPRWGTSGRGRVAGVHGVVQGASALDEPIPALARRGGAVVEPWLARTLDLSSQWVIHAEGDPELLGVTRQLTRGAGVYLGCELVMHADGAGLESGTRWDPDVVARARAVVAAAAAAGHRGPCGVDAFTYVDAEGVEVLRGVVELNARFTAGLVAVGLAARRGLEPRQRAVCRLVDEPMLSVVDAAPPAA